MSEVDLQALEAKRSSLRDKLRKRREAIGSLLSQTSPSSSSAAGTGTEARVAAEPSVDRAGPAAKRSRFFVGDEDRDGDDSEMASPVKAPPAVSSGSSPGRLADQPDHRRHRGKSSAVSAGGKDDVIKLLSAPSAKEKAGQEQREEILDLLGRPTAKEKSLLDSFRSSTPGQMVKQFCQHSTKAECMKARRAGGTGGACDKLHFARIIQPHTDEKLGDCSFLNTCFHMETCKYIHYEVDRDDADRVTPKQQHQHRFGGRGARNHDPSTLDGRSGPPASGGQVRDVSGIGTAARLVAPDKVGKVDGGNNGNGMAMGNNSRSSLVGVGARPRPFPPQWIQSDLRNLDLSVLGKFSVVMADPPWDIHMELPYGTMSDDEMRRLPVPALQDEGLIFLWVTGRAMELGRECLKLWGYERVDEIIWVKTNQLQRIIRTGRTGHWLNHGKEHCLVGIKGGCSNLNRGLDCDVIVAEVRATSHKPDEIYGMIERLSPGTRKVELFGRPHNVKPNWVTLGNQLDGVLIHDAEMLQRWYVRYPNGYPFTDNIMLHPRQLS